MSHHHQGWLWKTGAENVEQLNVIFCDILPIPTPNTNNYYSNLYDADKYDGDKKIVHRNCTNNVTSRMEPLSNDCSIKSK